MQCSKCGHRFTEVINTAKRTAQLTDDVEIAPAYVYRRRECPKCGHRFSTREKETHEKRGAPKKPGTFSLAIAGSGGVETLDGVLEYRFVGRGRFLEVNTDPETILYRTDNILTVHAYPSDQAEPRHVNIP